jgi:TonB family protein
MRLTVSSGVRVLLAAVLILLMCAPAPAQEPQIDALADQMAAALAQAKLKTVMVFDFVGPDEMDALGQKLAADFRAALAKSAHGIQVEDRSLLVGLLKKNDLAPSGLYDAFVAQWIALQSGADVWISGTLSNGSGGLTVTVKAFGVKSSDQIFKFETSAPLSDELKSLIGKSEEGEFASLPQSGKNGYSNPSCIHCPYAQFSAEATTRKFSGTVALEATVDENGQVKDIRVTKGLPLGLTQQAIKAVQEWRFKPATGPDGKPAAVRQKIQVTFHSY